MIEDKDITVICGESAMWYAYLHLECGLTYAIQRSLGDEAWSVIVNRPVYWTVLATDIEARTLNEAIDIARGIVKQDAPARIVMEALAR